MLESEILPYLYNSNNPGTITDIPRVDTAPQGVETPTQLAGYYLAEAHGACVWQEFSLGTTSRSRRTRVG